MALRALGLSLEQVRAALDDEVELRPLIERQLEAADAAVELQRLLDRADGLLERWAMEPVALSGGG